MQKSNLKLKWVWWAVGGLVVVLLAMTVLWPQPKKTEGEGDDGPVAAETEKKEEKPSDDKEDDMPVTVPGSATDLPRSGAENIVLPGIGVAVAVYLVGLNMRLMKERKTL